MALRQQLKEPEGGIWTSLDFQLQAGPRAPE